MDIFSTLEGKTFKLNKVNIENNTIKKAPYYIKNEDGKYHYYAICPRCGNPIVIINLYKKNYEDNLKRKIKLHGRHLSKDIEGLAKYDNIKYKNCPLANPKTFGLTKRVSSNPINIIIRDIVENHKDEIHKDIQNIIGINISKKLYNNLYDLYMNSCLYEYDHADEYNIPYVFIYTQSEINLHMQYLKNNSMGKKIEEAINNKSAGYKVENNQIIPKTKNHYELGLILINHSVKDDKKQTFDMLINETINNKSINLFKVKITYESYIYSDK